MMRAWLFQDYRQRKKLGNKAPWCVGWIDPEGRKRSKRVGVKSLANKLRKEIEADLVTGKYTSKKRRNWIDYRDEYVARISQRAAARTQEEILGAIKHFERIIKPIRLDSIKTQTIDRYTAQRCKERGRNLGDFVSPATVNKELRHLRSVLQIAFEWGYVNEVPRFRMMKESKKIPNFVTSEHFAAIYEACRVATLPKDLAISAPDWWQSLLVFEYMTGWRVGEPLALRRNDLDLERGVAITRAEDNKGNRDELVPLHPVVVEHLSRICSFHSLVFPWPHHRTTLWLELERIQLAAGIHLPCQKDHLHTVRCHLYAFHDFRRAFATMNAGELSPDSLQSLMRHKSYSTTQRYINIARQLNPAIENLHVPDVLKRGSA